MKAYGHSRRDMLNCKYGCCGTKSDKNKLCRGVVDKSHRKSARQDSKESIKKEYYE